MAILYNLTFLFFFFILLFIFGIHAQKNNTQVTESTQVVNNTISISNISDDSSLI